jgi:hypothetical protein
MRLLLSTSILFVLYGCDTGPAFLPAALPEPPAMDLLPPVQTNIPPGVYIGTVRQRFVQTAKGVTLIDQTTESAYSETVDGNGLPLIQPEGIVPQVGALARFTQSNLSGWLQVTSVQTSNNQLVIYYREAYRRQDGLQLEGSGKWIYRFEAPNKLHYQGSSSLSGFLIDDGTPTGATFDDVAELTSG